MADPATITFAVKAAVEAAADRRTWKVLGVLIAAILTPYKDSTVTIAPGITSAVIQCQKELNLTDDELKAVMLDRINRLSAPFHLFTPEECVDIVLMESREDIDGLTKIYAKAKRRFKQRFPDIKC